MNIMSRLAAAAITLCSVITFASSVSAGEVKLSNSGICHDEASSYYTRTKKFTPYASMGDCLSAGRAYQGYSGSTDRAAPAQQKSTIPTASENGGSTYDRELYDHWIDVDGDCQNARHETLIALATGPVTLSRSGCTVDRGRWNDPYTGKIFFDAGELDIDHMVPLAWAHAHGADQWDASMRRKFANEPINLFAVEASANRAKGAKGPLNWLPPDAQYQCEYITRFHRIVLTYKLAYGQQEGVMMDNLRANLCSR